MAELSLSFKVDTTGVAKGIARMTTCVARWPQEKRHKFISEWDELEAAGAQTADVGFVYGVVYAWISDDLRQHCRKWGIDI